MSKQADSIEYYTFSETDALLFDANIWLYIYGPQRQLYPRIASKYTLALRRIRGAKSQIFIDVLVLSEFINAYSRFAYNDLPAATKPPEFKTFRNSANFVAIAKDIAKYSRKILGKCERIESGFESVNFGMLLSEYAVGEADFNDQILAELCKAKSLKLVTHDIDFSGSNLTILTANPRLLK